MDVASLDSMFSTLGIRLISQLMLGESMPRSGSRDPLTAPVNVYEAADGPVYVQAGTNSLFPRLCAAMGRDDLAADPVNATVQGRMANQTALEAEVAACVRERTRADVGQALDQAGVPWSEVASVAEVAASPQIAAREMVVDVEHPTLGTLRVPGSPIKLSATPVRYRKAPPTVGEDTDDVFARVLGMSPERIDALRRAGAIR